MAPLRSSKSRQFGKVLFHMETDNLSDGFGSSGSSETTYNWASPSSGNLFTMNIFEDEVIDGINLNTNPGATTFEVSSGALPSGISLSGAQLVGTMPSVNSDTSYSFNLKPSDGDVSSSRSFSIVVKEDPSKAYDSNLKLWIQGGYNNRSTGNLGSTSSPGGTFPIARFNGSTGVAYGFAPTTLPQAVDPTSETGWGAGKEINDSLGGTTKQLQLDRLAIHMSPGTTTYVRDGWGSYAGVNHTFTYWLYWDNISQTTGGNNFCPTFHCWGSNPFTAHDWQTNGTSNAYQVVYLAGANRGTWNVSNVAGAVNGNKAVWHHIAMVCSSGQTLCYLNGSLDATLGGSTSNWSVGTQYCNFHGRGDNVNNNLPGSYTSGYGPSKKMADIRYYNTNLSAAAIQAIYQKLRPAF